MPARHAAALDWAAAVGYGGVGYWFTTVGYCGSTVVRYGEFVTSDDDARRTAFDRPRCPCGTGNDPPSCGVLAG